MRARQWITTLLLIVLTTLFACHTPVRADADTNADAPPGMVWVPSGEFTMGTDDETTLPNEHPAHRVKVSGFWMDVTPVTNAQFRAFVVATGYVTVAERAVDWEAMKKEVPPGTPKPSDEMLQPGSLVYTSPGKPVPLQDLSRWWAWVHGADWQHPDGPGSGIEGMDDYPVVQVSWEDAAAYAEWAGKRLPTEAEWEYASRGGTEGTRYYWGDELQIDGQYMANTYTGVFPAMDTGADGYAGRSPVKAFPPNGYGLYDMAGNVWQWTADMYRYDRHAQLAQMCCPENPQGPAETFDPADPYSMRRVIKGGSYLCNVSYCESYRPTARRGTPPDTGSSHVGFRCVISDHPQPAMEDQP